MHSQHETPHELIARVTAAVSEEVGRVVFGHHEHSRLLTGAFLIGGHVLLEGPPGIAKTLLAKTFASTLGLTFRRIQFTPDLMPSDITGINILDSRTGAFRFAPGPLFTDILLADEINRTPPKTQSALLEAMEERQMTIDGERHALGAMFFVIATQNPIEHEGTFPLPEAQLDRFLFKLHLTYPGEKFEEAMIQSLSGESGLAQQTPEVSRKEVVDIEDLARARALLRKITLSESISSYIMQIVGATRAHPHVLLGASPRAGLNFALAAKLQAAQSGRDYVIPDDVKLMARPVLNHRLLLKPESFDVIKDVHEIVDDVVRRTPTPAT